MKKLLILIALIMAILSGWFLNQYYAKEFEQFVANIKSISSSQKGISQQQESYIDKKIHEIEHLDPNYVCPMHPQIIKGEPGSCPICGMDLIEVEIENELESVAEQKPKKEISHATKHLDPNYVCPMHPQIIKGKPGSCPICGMDLIEVEVEEEKVSGEKNNKEKIVLYWVAPMDANYRRDEPGQSPMGMDLVPVYAEHEDEHDDTKTVRVKIDPAVVNNLGVIVEEVKRGKLARQLETVAYVEYNEDNLSHVHQLSDGWIEKLVVKNLGTQVKKGDLLYAIYSPELMNAQEDYLLALKNKFKRVQKASQERLYTLGFSASQIRQLKKTKKIRRRLNVYSRHSGIVTQLNVREGMYVKPQTEIMTLADLSSVWLMAEIYEKQVSWVKVGDQVSVSLQSFPGKTWQSQVQYIYPELDKLSRTIRVRIPMPNPQQQFKLNMYAKVKVEVNQKNEVLHIPSQAIIRSGRENRVIVQNHKGSFSPKQVVIGMESDQDSEIISGLNEGEKVVLSGQFLIDSEASLKASLLRFTSNKSDK